MKQVENSNSKGIGGDDITIVSALVEAVAIDEEEEDVTYNDDGGGSNGAAAAASASATGALSASSVSASPSSAPRLHLVRNVTTGKFLDASGAASSDPTTIYLQPRNGRPAQLFSFEKDGRIVSALATTTTQQLKYVLTAEWSAERQSCSRVVRWTEASKVRDTADAAWDLTADGTVMHRATGQVLGLGLNRIGWRGCKLHLYDPDPHNDLQQFQVLPIDLIK
jgi:Ricin-type beta-trefoil lectin domain